MLKKAILLTAFLATLILTSPSHALTWNGGYHLFDSGSENEVYMINAATADITGGYIAALVLYDTCSATIDGGNLGLLRPEVNSTIDIYDCDILTVLSLGDSRVDIYGGTFRELNPGGDSSMYLYVNSYKWYPESGRLNGGLITGTWHDSGEIFSIDLMSVGDINYLTFVPEPGSISFILMGSLVLIKRKQ